MPFPPQPPSSVPSQVITLNSINYLVRSVEVESARNWGEVFSQVGGQLRASRAGPSQWDMSEHNGLGRNLILKMADWQGTFVNSTVETRFPDQITLGGLWTAEVTWTPAHRASPNNTDLDVIGGVAFDSEIWVIEEYLSGSNYGIQARRFDETGTPAWDVTEVIVSPANTNRKYPFSLVAHASVLAALVDTAETLTIYTRAIGSSTWTSRAMTSFTLPAYAAGDRGLLCSISNRLYCAFWDASVGAIRIGYSTDSGANFTMGSIGDIITAYQPTGFVGAYNGTTTVPHLCTAEALWELNVNGDTPVKVKDFQANISEWNGVGMATWEQDSALYVPLGGNPLGQLMKYTREGDDRQFEMVGLDKTAWPSARQGRIVRLFSTPRWLLALVRNTGNSECGIWAWDGVGWHSLYYSDSTDNQAGWPTTGTLKPQAFGVSNVDGTQRLHLIWDNGTNTDACHTKNPLEDPTNVSGFVYAPTGVLTWPWFGGDTLEDQKGLYKMWGVGDDLTADEKITYGWAQDGGTSFTDLTALTASGSTNFPSTSSSVGLSAKTLQMRMSLARGGTNTLSPIVRASVLSYLTVPTTRLRFILNNIDIEESYQHQELATTKVDRETMITNLETARDSVTLVGFVYPYGATSRNVKVLPDSFRGVYTISKDTDGKATQQRTGFVSLVVEEY